jgi:hypothetical protein
MSDFRAKPIISDREAMGFAVQIGHSSECAAQPILRAAHGVTPRARPYRPRRGNSSPPQGDALRNANQAKPRRSVPTPAQGNALGYATPFQEALKGRSNPIRGCGVGWPALSGLSFIWLKLPALSKIRSAPAYARGRSRSSPLPVGERSECTRSSRAFRVRGLPRISESAAPPHPDRASTLFRRVGEQGPRRGGRICRPLPPPGRGEARLGQIERNLLQVAPPKSALPDFGTIDVEIGNSRFRLSAGEQAFGCPATFWRCRVGANRNYP